MGFIEKTMMIVMPAVMVKVFIVLGIIFAAKWIQDTSCTTPIIYHLLPYCEYGFQSNLRKAKVQLATYLATQALSMLGAPGEDDWESRVTWMKDNARSLAEKTKDLGNLVNTGDSGTHGQAYDT